MAVKEGLTEAKPFATQHATSPLLFRHTACARPLPAPGQRGIVRGMSDGVPASPHLAAGDFRVEPMAPAHQAAWLHFFDQVAFADNPRWASCYCQFPTADHEAQPWKERSAADNRGNACQRIAAGEQHGVIALDGAGQVIGWCNAGPAKGMTIRDTSGPAEPDLDRLAAIACFIVAPAWRGRGVSQALLAGACVMLKSQGFTEVEGWTRPNVNSPTANHTGSFTLYQRAGFDIWREPVEDGVVMRRAL